MRKKDLKQKFSNEAIKRSIYQIRFLDDRALEAIKDQSKYFRIYPGNENTFYVSTGSLLALRKLTKKFEVVREIQSDQTGITIDMPSEVVLYDHPTEDVEEEIVALALSRKDRAKPCNPIYCGRSQVETENTFVMDRPGGSRNYRWRWDMRKRKANPPDVRDRFPKLIKRMTDKDTRFVISLSGGGLLLFAHPSIFKLMEVLGVQDHIEEIWGCSGGAIAGMAYALGAKNDVIEQEGFDIYNRKYSLELGPKKMEVLKNLLLSRIIPGSSLRLEGFVDIQTDLQESLHRIIKAKRPIKPFFSIAYNMDLRRSEVLTPSRVNSKIYGDHIKHCTPFQAVMASSAIPVLFYPCVIKRGKTSYTFIDGSFAEEVPLNSIYYKWQMDRKHGITKKKKLFVISVNLFPFFSRQIIFSKFLTKYFPIFEMGSILLRLVDLVRRVKVDEDISAINTDPDAKVVEMRLPKQSQYNFLNPQIIPVVIERARGTFFEQLLQIESKL